jgi:cell division protease FtsH
MQLSFAVVLFYCLTVIQYSGSYQSKRSASRPIFQLHTYRKNYQLSQRYIEQLLHTIKLFNKTSPSLEDYNPNYYENLLKQLNSKNATTQTNAILGEQEQEQISEDDDNNNNNNSSKIEIPRVHIILNNSPHFLAGLGIEIQDEDNFGQDPDEDPYQEKEKEKDEEKKPYRRLFRNNPFTKETPSYTKSKNFEVLKESGINFGNVGGYENVKDELRQCVDILKNYQKYRLYNVRIPKGLILEGPPGTGKTLIAKALAGEAKCGFIPVSGSDFQEKYVGVGSSRIKELFRLAKENTPCIIFVDEMDALGRKRSSDGESSSSERDNTLNALLVELDGFKNISGVFMIAATNRIDLLDTALTRPGRIDKKIYIGLPDKKTRDAILNIHIQGKPHDKTIDIPNLVEITEGLSGAQIENLLNEAMLNALRCNKTEFNFNDFDFIMNKMVAGWQPNEHQFTSDIIDHIAIHEMGHAVVGFLSKHHSKMSKVVINLSSPKSPGYTVFESSTSNIYVREALFEHLMILLSGRIAEEVFYNVSVTTGALNDFEEALKLAEKMVLYYGMGSNVIYPSNSEKYKELIDNDVIELINNAYNYAQMLIIACKPLIYETSEILKRDKLLRAEELNNIIITKYFYLTELKMEFE